MKIDQQRELFREKRDYKTEKEIEFAKKTLEKLMEDEEAIMLIRK